MRHRSFSLFLGTALLTITLLATTGLHVARAQTTPPDIGTQLMLASKVQRGQVVRASLVLEIPDGYHVNAHNPVSRFALPTKVEVETPDGMKVGSIVYPKAIVRRFTFSQDRLGVYEKRAVILIRIIVPPNQPKGRSEIKARLNYQSCSNEVCFPPTKREVTASVNVL